MVTLGSAAGAGAGYALGDEKPGAIAAGAVGGALLTALAAGDDPAVFQKGVDEGYALGAADATKRLYFAKQALEKAEDGGETRTTYYSFPGPEETADGRKLVPNTVVVPVLEPVDKPTTKASR